MPQTAIDQDVADQLYYREAREDVPDLGALAGRSPAADTLLSDVHAALFKLRPELNDQADVAHRGALADLMETREYARLRATTRMHELASALGTVELGRELAEAIPEEEHQDDDQGDHQDQAGPGGPGGQPGPQGPGAPPLLKGCADQDEQRRQLRAMAARAAEKTEEAVDALQALAGAGKWSPEDGYGPSERMGEALAQIERIRSSAKLKQILKMAGRIRRAGSLKRETRYKHGPDDVADVELGRDLGSLLPSELQALVTPEMETWTLLRYAQRQLLQVRREGRERADQGPLVVLLDESGSMNTDRETWAKAVTLALLDVARVEGRDFAVVGFNTGTRLSHWGTKPTQTEVLNFLDRGVRGGTSFDKALDVGIGLVERDVESGGRWEKADLILITDGDDVLYDPEGYRARLEACGAHLYTVYVQTHGTSLDRVSDGVARLLDVEDDDRVLDLVFGF